MTTFFAGSNPNVIPSVCEESLAFCLLIIPNEYEESPTNYKRFFLPAIVRMTTMSSRTHVRDLMSYALLAGDSSRLSLSKRYTF